MGKKEQKNNIKFILIAFIATALLLSSCQKSQLKENNYNSSESEQDTEEISENFEDVENFKDLDVETSGQLSMDSEMKNDEADKFYDETDEYYAGVILAEQPLVRSDIVLDLTDESQKKWDLEFLGENNVAIRKCDDSQIEKFDYDVIRVVDSRVGQAKEYKIVSVRASAFMNCRELKEFNSQYVTSIETMAFSGCSSLKSVRVASTITEIGNSAFNKCARLNSFNVDPEGDAYIWLPVSLVLKQSQGVGNDAFNGCLAIKDLCFYLNKNMSDLDKYKNDLGKISKNAFRGCNIDSVSYAVSEKDIDDEKNGLGIAIYEYFGFSDEIDAYTLVATEFEEN